MVQQLHTNQFKSLFTGNQHNYGHHQYNFSKEGEKEKGTNKTIKDKLITIEEYKRHLNGQEGLGIIPIDEDNKCSFSVIDVDIYDVSLLGYVRAIYENNFPLIPFRSKSGGLHIYIFWKSPILAKNSIEICRKLSQLLGIDILVKSKKNEAVEVFPKQYKLQPGNVGSWINLPYYDAENNTKQVALDRSGEPISLDKALGLIKEKQTTLTDVNDFIQEVAFNDGPPCLQTMYFINAVKKNNGRNNYLFAFGTYLKKKDENFFEQALFEVNQSLDDPIDSQELEKTVIQSLRKKDYSYPCTKSPCVDFCRKKICKTREFGVGKEDGYFSNVDYGKMYQIQTSSPYYEWEVKRQEDEEFKKLRFRSEEEIIRQDAFLKMCFRNLHYLPSKLKQTEWFKLVNQYLIEIEVVHINEEDDISPYTLFKTLFYDFILNRAMANTRDQINNKRVFFDKKQASYYFRSKDLLEFLYLNKNFRSFNPTEIHGILRDLKATTKRIRTETGKQLRVYSLPSEKIDPDTMMEEEVKENFTPNFDDFDEKDF